MQRKAIIPAVLAAMVLSSGCTPGPLDARPETEMDRVVRKQLDTIISKLDFEDMELSQTFQFLRDVIGANFHVRWRVLASEGVKPTDTVNVHLSNVTFRKALEIILDDAAAGGKSGLDYVVDNGVITISTKSDLRKLAATRSRAKGDRVAYKPLDTKLSKLDFEDMELSQIFQFLRDISGANIHVRWRAMALESIKPATTVNVHLSNVTFRKALEIILDDAAAGDKGGLDYIVDDGVITISTKSDLRKPFDTRWQAETETDQVLQKLLDTRVSKLDFEDMEISQVFQFLRDVSGANIQVKWRALALESIEPKTTVNVHLSNVTFRKALEIILQDVAAGGKPSPCYVVNDGVITISTRSDLRKPVDASVSDNRYPRVGKLVKLEKTLVKPSDEMVARFDYQWKGR